MGARLPEISVLLQVAFGGLTMGAVYGILAVSLLMVYRVSKIICFAQGEFFVIGGLALATLTEQAGLPLWAAIPVVLLGAALLGLAIERGAISPVQRSGIGIVITMTIALSIALQGLALPIWGRQAHTVAPFVVAAPVEVLGAFVSAQVLIVIGTAVAVYVLLWLFFTRTTLGLAMRAAAQAPVGAQLVGISVRKLNRIGWASGVALGALAGMVVAPVIFLTYASGTMPMVKAFIAMAIGGLGSTAGALVGGFLVGTLEAYTIGFLSSEFADAIVFGVLILFLLVRPTGVFAASDKGGM